MFLYHAYMGDARLQQVSNLPSLAQMPSHTYDAQECQLLPLFK